MPRKYRYIKEYEQEIVELKKQGKTNQLSHHTLTFFIEWIHPCLSE